MQPLPKTTKNDSTIHQTYSKIIKRYVNHSYWLYPKAFKLNLSYFTSHTRRAVGASRATKILRSGTGTTQWLTRRLPRPASHPQGGWGESLGKAIWRSWWVSWCWSGWCWSATFLKMLCVRQWCRNSPWKSQTLQTTNQWYIYWTGWFFGANVRKSSSMERIGIIYEMGNQMWIYGNHRIQ